MRLLLLAFLAIDLSAATLAAISGDAIGVPRQFNLLDAANAAASSPFALGNTSQGFTGGLAWVASAQRYYTIYEDAGQSVLASFDAAGTLSGSSLPLDSGAWRGLTYDSAGDVFYALYTPSFGPFELREIDLAAGAVTSLFQGPAAGFGGMTYIEPGRLTALFTNATGQYQLHSIDLAAQTITPFGIAFEVNMNGGLAWDTDTAQRYFAIGSDSFGNSSLYGIVADGSAYGSQFGVGGGYFYGALSYSGDTAAAPEPSTLLLAAPLAYLLRRKRMLN